MKKDFSAKMRTFIEVKCCVTSVVDEKMGRYIGIGVNMEYGDRQKSYRASLGNVDVERLLASKQCLWCLAFAFKHLVPNHSVVALAVAVAVVATAFMPHAP